MDHNSVHSPFVERLWDALKRSGYHAMKVSDGYAAFIAPEGCMPVCLMDGNGKYAVCRHNFMKCSEKRVHLNAIKAVYRSVVSDTLNPFGQKCLSDLEIEEDGSFWSDELRMCKDCPGMPASQDTEDDAQELTSELRDLLGSFPDLQNVSGVIVGGLGIPPIVLTLPLDDAPMETGKVVPFGKSEPDTAPENGAE